MSIINTPVIPDQNLASMDEGVNYIQKDKEDAYIIKKTIYPDLYSIITEFRFVLDTPYRFDTIYTIPGNAANSCVTLNESILLGLFSDYLPQDAVIPNCLTSKSGHCSDNGQHYTPLSPGKSQHINFRWNNGDTLKIYVYIK